MAIERYSSKTDVVVKLVLVFFVCLLSFSIGTFVGKKFSDNQHRQARFEQGSEAGERGLASADSSAKTTGTLTDEEIAKLAEEFVNEDEPTKEETVAAKPAAAGGEAVAAAPAKPKAEVSEAAMKVAKAEKPAAAVAAVAAPAPVAQRIPSSLPKEIASSPIGKFTVQVGSFPSEAEATKRVEKLKAAGMSAFFVEAKIKDKEGDSFKTWYRVSVGLFTTQKEADDYKSEIVTAKKVDSAIVQKISK